MKQLGVFVLGLMLTGSLAPAAYAQRDQKPPKNDNRGGDKKNPPGPIVREEKRGDGNNRGGDKKPPKPPRPGDF